MIGAQYVTQLEVTSPKNLKLPESEQTQKIISFDMGGTSTDVALIDGTPKITTEAVIGGHPISLPMLDIHTIGAGGGSIAHIDAGGALRVGPQSAGAYPGPACYGRGNIDDDLPTVTDANLVLGRLPADYFLGGEFPLDSSHAMAALETLGAPLRLDPVQAADGVIQVVNAHMHRAILSISVERGYDPKDLTLVSYGGSGGLHAAALARSVGIQQILIPPQASTLSALGMIAADAVKDYSQTVMLGNNASVEIILQSFFPLRRRAQDEMLKQGISAELFEVQESLDIRYLGQSYELTIPFNEDYREEFHKTHEKLYGYYLGDRPIEVVNCRLRAIGHTQKPTLQAQPFAGTDPSSALLDKRQVYLQSSWRQAPFYIGNHLRSGNLLNGPCVVIRDDTTVLLFPGDAAQVDSYGNLIIQLGE